MAEGNVNRALQDHGVELRLLGVLGQPAETGQGHPHHVR
jgi:hypothetical protein